MRRAERRDVCATDPLWLRYLGSRCADHTHTEKIDSVAVDLRSENRSRHRSDGDRSEVRTVALGRLRSRTRLGADQGHPEVKAYGGTFAPVAGVTPPHSPIASS